MTLLGQGLDGLVQALPPLPPADSGFIAQNCRALCFCCGQNVGVPHTTPNSNVETLTPNVFVFGAFGE